jgi:Glycosyl transferase family 11
MRIHLLQKRGLGNQLFQYAAGLFFAKRHGATLEIVQEPDRYAVSFGHPRPFLLSYFNISTPVREFTLWDRLMCSGTVVYVQPFVEDGTFLPALPVPQSTRNVYVEGNFQAYQFAQDVEQRVRSEFSFRNPPRGKNLEMLERMRAAGNSVSLHVRRGDYTVNRGGQELLPIDYYRQAMEAILQRVSDPTFFVFSDDIAYSRENLPKGERMVFVDHNDQANGHEDLRLMAACSHNIIANSTMSWWGAWLNPNPTKLVCAPKVWRNPKISYADLIPSGWLRIANEASSTLSHPAHDRAW